jgi:hypothetical protein
MTTETDFTKKRLALILSALDDAPRSPANKGEALRAIGRSAARIGLTAEDVLAAAPGLLDERLTPAEFRAELQDLTAGSDSAAEAEPDAPAAEEAATAPREGEEAPPAAEAPEVAEPAPTAAEAAPEAPAAASPAEAQPAGDLAYYDDYPTRGTPADQGAWAARRDDAAREAEAAARPTPRAGTKQAQMIDLLKRPEGATVEQIAERTGWQHHTIRGAISGALKKKLGLTIEATRTREHGPNKTGAKGSSTVYRIVEPA